MCESSAVAVADKHTPAEELHWSLDPKPQEPCSWPSLMRLPHSEHRVPTLSCARNERVQLRPRPAVRRVAQPCCRGRYRSPSQRCRPRIRTKRPAGWADDFAPSFLLVELRRFGAGEVCVLSLRDRRPSIWHPQSRAVLDGLMLRGMPHRKQRCVPDIDVGQRTFRSESGRREGGLACRLALPNPAVRQLQDATQAVVTHRVRACGLSRHQSAA